MSQIVIENLFKVYPHPAANIVALQDINLTIAPGELVAIMGDAGAGKTTLIRLLGALDRPSAGEIVINGRNVAHLTRHERRMFWQREVSFIESAPRDNVLPYLSILENIKRRIQSDTASAHRQALDALAAIGLQEKAHHVPKQLSRLENQLIAIAGAVCNQPTLILADEPAAGLAEDEAAIIYSAIAHLAVAQTISVILTAEMIPPAHWEGRLIGLEHGILVENPLPALASSVSAYIDQRGRLQIPKALLEQLGIDAQADLQAEHGYLKIAAFNPNESPDTL